MPIYTYHCTSCNESLEQIRKIDERDRLTICRRCRKPVDRNIDSPGMVWAPTAGGMKV
jgi:putative FmdB family regulatory protein